jgi:FkbM family methyltransferase
MADLLGERVVIVGAGGLGRTLLRGLREQSISVVAVVDNDPNRWGETIGEVVVRSAREAADLYGSDAVFVIAIWNAGRRRNQTDVRRQLQSLGCQSVISFVEAFRCFPDSFLPYFAVDRAENVASARESVDRAFALLADDRSQDIFQRQLNWRVTADFDLLSSPGDEPQYFPPDVYRLRDDEAFVDCGAFDGDTLRQFLSLTDGAFSHYWALEPDERNFEALVSFVRRLPADSATRITCLPLAASDREGQERFDARGSASSTVSDAGSVAVNCARLDDLVDACTIIKLDVEGAEPRVLDGARRLIRESSPVLAISAYHTQAHLWELPLLVHSMNPSYELLYREHNEEGFDLVLYAVPPSRRR